MHHRSIEDYRRNECGDFDVRTPHDKVKWQHHALQQIVPAPPASQVALRKIDEAKLSRADVKRLTAVDERAQLSSARAAPELDRDYNEREEGEETRKAADAVAPVHEEDAAMLAETERILGGCNRTRGGDGVVESQHGRNYRRPGCHG